VLPVAARRIAEHWDELWDATDAMDAPE
jgi:hypothetical protein